MKKQQTNVFPKQKKTLIIDKKKFTDWAFDDETIWDIGKAHVGIMIEKGEVTHTLKGVLLGMGYLPFNIIKNKEVLWAGKKYIDTTDDTDIDNPEDYNLIFDYEVKECKKKVNI